jgi:predicted AlkP superfamily pyrophosphatase or phosphodiesterase
MLWRRFLWLTVVFAWVVAAPAAPRPRLVVVISIDQFRADYLDRFDPWYRPAKQGQTFGGFRYLRAFGADFADAHHGQVPTATGPGHAALLTGAPAALTGIIGNEWFVPSMASDPTTEGIMYCVYDPLAKVVGGGDTKPMSPRNLLTTTLGDELKMATAGQGKVVAVAFKDRAAILMAGHAADTVIWFDNTQGSWVSSDFFCPSGQLPQWVTDWNAKRLPKDALGKKWTPMLPASAYAFTRVSPTLKPSSTTLPFEHVITGKDGDKGAYATFTVSSFGQEYVFATAKEAIVKEQLGQDEVPDVFCLNLATNDYVGHAYGPNSPEVMDISVRTDRLLGDLFGFLDKQIPGGMNSVLVVVSADHGVVPIAEESGKVYRTGSVRVSSAELRRVVNEALAAKFGPGDYVLAATEPNWYLNQRELQARNADPAVARKIAADAVTQHPGMYIAFTRDAILSGALPRWDWARLVANNLHPRLSGDFLVFEAPGNYMGGGTGTGHGSPWVYDTHVPIILCGPQVRRGRYFRRVEVLDIAPTLSVILGIEAPNGSQGRLLQEALGG